MGLGSRQAAEAEKRGERQVKEGSFCRAVTAEMTSPDRPALSNDARDPETADMDGVAEMRLVSVSGHYKVSATS